MLDVRIQFGSAALRNAYMYIIYKCIAAHFWLKTNKNIVYVLMCVLCTGVFVCAIFWYSFIFRGMSQHALSIYNTTIAFSNTMPRRSQIIILSFYALLYVYTLLLGRSVIAAADDTTIAVVAAATLTLE